MDPVEVAPGQGSAPSSQSPDPEPSSSVTKDDPPPKKQNVRKRTKTGCLTCRKRRIKCDEAKPTCNNCIKSKRHCEGYNPRVVFKEPIGAFHPHGAPFGTVVYGPRGALAEPMDAFVRSAQLQAAQPRTSLGAGPLPVIAPKPPGPLPDWSTSPGYVPPTYHAHLQAHQQQQQQQRSASIPTIPLGAIPDYGRSHYSVDASFHPMAPSIAPGQPPYHQDESLNLGLPQHGMPLGIDQQHLSPTLSPGYEEQILSGTESGSELRSPTHGMPYVTEEIDEGGDYWDPDDDASMPDSDEEYQGTDMDHHTSHHLQANDLGVLVARRLDKSPDMHGIAIRTFSYFADEGILAHYRPSSTNSPLNDAQCAAIFTYFINTTGPSMSLYERVPFDPSVMFEGQPVPKIRQHIWTYTFPTIALGHPALLQAILALGSLQMAKLQGIPITASMKHYHLSLRRLSRNYQNASRRVQPATLAATLLLGFYEVWNSDHDKWCKHLWGARAIIKEIPLREMTKAVLELRRKEQQEMMYEQLYDQYGLFSGEMEDSSRMDVNIPLLNLLSGKQVDYSSDSRVSEDMSWVPPPRFTEKDLEVYDNVVDLYWWYCKMDVYQSTLGGTRLLMDYDLWTQCPPRAPIGRINAVYGTFDHLILLLGRLASFASRDQSRKRKMKPPPGAPGPPPGHSPPPFAGMMPSSGRVTIPTGFSPPAADDSPPGSETSADAELNMEEALREWHSIHSAFIEFKKYLGEDFEPLGPEFYAPEHTPFGPAIRYRTYGIQGIWMNYYLGMIALHRAHPHMPPLAMVAAGMAARETAKYAMLIGRMAAGIQEDCETASSVSTLGGAIYMESSFPLFVAAVQFQSQDQRSWTISRLYNIARVTGWQSARQIAYGCETAWTKAAQLGRGPPYIPRALDDEVKSVWDRPRRLADRMQEVGEGDAKIVLSTTERPHYAFGLLSVESDFTRLAIKEEGE